MRMGYREYARHRGCTLAAVQKAIASGRIVILDGKKIDSEDADRRWAATTDPAQQRKDPPPPPPLPAMPLFSGAPLPAPAALSRHIEWPDPLPPLPPPRRDVPKPPDNVVGMDTYLSAKTERERAEAELAKDALAKSRNRLIDADEARSTFRAIGRMFAQARENIPTQLATKIVGKTDPGEIERTIREAFREADKRIADEIQARFANFVNDVHLSSISG